MQAASLLPRTHSLQHCNKSEEKFQHVSQINTGLILSKECCYHKISWIMDVPWQVKRRLEKEGEDFDWLMCEAAATQKLHPLPACLHEKRWYIDAYMYASALCSIYTHAIFVSCDAWIAQNQQYIVQLGVTNFLMGKCVFDRIGHAFFTAPWKDPSVLGSYITALPLHNLCDISFILPWRGPFACVPPFFCLVLYG